MNSVNHEPFKKNFNETGETPNDAQLITSQTLTSIFKQPLKQWLTGAKRREDGNTKI